MGSRKEVEVDLDFKGWWMIRNSCIEYLAIFIIVGSLHNFILCTAIRVGNIGFISHKEEYEIKRLKRVPEGSAQSECRS